MSSVVNEGALGVLIPGDIINTIGSIVVPAKKPVEVGVRGARRREKRGGGEGEKEEEERWEERRRGGRRGRRRGPMTKW